MASVISCSVQNRQAESIWINGTANGSMGTAWDGSRAIELIYLSTDQKLVMTELKSGIWNDATIITDKAIGDWSTSTDSGSSNSTSEINRSSSPSGLSTGAKAGIAASVVVVVVLSLSTAAFLFWRRNLVSGAWGGGQGSLSDSATPPMLGKNAHHMPTINTCGPPTMKYTHVRPLIWPWIVYYIVR